jgi:Flp pilus assembly protein TadG
MNPATQEPGTSGNSADNEGMEDRSDRERGGGAVSVPMAICILAILAVAGLAVDGVRAAQGIARADAIAEEAARAAGQALDPAALATGTAVIAPAAAADAARAYIAATGATGEVTVTGPDRVRVEVTLQRPTVLLGLVGREVLTSRGTAEAVLVPVLPGGTP